MMVWNEPQNRQIRKNRCFTRIFIDFEFHGTWINADTVRINTELMSIVKSFNVKTAISANSSNPCHSCSMCA